MKRGLFRLVVAVQLALLSTAGPTSAQSPEPNLTRTQRAALRALVTTVDAPIPRPEPAPAEWPLHVLRASDGSHYVAFSIVEPAGIRAGQPVVLYVRLATRGLDKTVERSAVADWLAGQRSTPLKPQRGVAFGEMPIFGAGASAVRGPGPQELRMLEAERERARVRREDEERERKAALEGTGAPKGPNALMPFEDFDANLVLNADASGMVMLRRSFIAGPGDYDLIVGWTDPSAKDPAAAAHVVRRLVQLPAASTSGLALSSVVLADDVTLRETPIPANQQTAHPYSIGPIEIVPARDQVLTNDERLALVVQIINPRATLDGKPDVAVGFRLFRTTGAGQESVGTLAPQVYNASTLPADFDVTKGHPIFAAVGVPLRTFKRGAYRVQIVADDRIAGVSAGTEATFSIAGTPAALLRDAPPLARPFRRDDALGPAVLTAVANALRPASPSPALAQGLDSLKAGRFVDLVRADSVNPSEQGARELLRAIGLFALGDTPNALSAPLRLAQEHRAPVPPLRVMIGASSALEGRDKDALAAWMNAAEGGFDARALAPLIIEAHLRLGDTQQALGVAGRMDTPSADARLARSMATVYLTLDREAEALALLDAELARQPDDADTQWLLLHALFSGVVRGQGAGATAPGKERFRQVARGYIAAKGRYATLAEEWLNTVP